MMRWLDSITNSMHMNLSKLQERVRYREAWPAAVRGVTKNGYNSVTEEQLPLKEKGKYINLQIEIILKEFLGYVFPKKKKKKKREREKVISNRSS